MQGFGASGAWWPNDLISYPAATQQLVGKLLFTTEGIDLSAYRYNIGGGGKGVTNPARVAKQYPDDVAGRTFLRMASDARVPLLTGFVNSAPPQFTTNAQACGGSLKPGAETAFAAYLAGIVGKIHDDGIAINFVSPMNEPDDSFPDCGQEGMKVPVEQRAPMVKALSAALERGVPGAKVIADETTADAILAAEAPQWLATGDTASKLAAIAHHTYDFPNDALRAPVRALSRRFDRPTWMTEICCYKGSGGVGSSMGAEYDPTMAQGLWLADQIYSDLTVAGDSAWYWWTALSPVLGCDPRADRACPSRVNTKGFNDGLIYYDQKHATDGMTNLYPSKRFYVLGQFSRYVRPGAVRHDVTGAPSGVRVMAFAAGGSWTIVAWNETSADRQIGVALPAGGHAPTHNAGTITGAGSSLQSRPPAGRTASGAWVVPVPAGAVVTYTFT